MAAFNLTYTDDRRFISLQSLDRNNKKKTKF